MIWKNLSFKNLFEAGIGVLRLLEHILSCFVIFGIFDDELVAMISLSNILINNFGIPLDRLM